MKKSLVLAMAMALGVTASAYAANPFSDVPAGHWAYDNIAKLAAAGVIEGYGDDTFRGDRLMTRYEMAQIVAKAMAKGANVDRLAAEFADELDALGVRVAALEKKADNVKITGYFRYDYATWKQGTADGETRDHRSKLRSRLWFNGQVNDNWKYVGMLEDDQNLDNNAGDKDLYLQRAYLQGRLGGMKVMAGRYHKALVDSEVYGARADGIDLTYGDKVKLNGYYMKPTDTNNWQVKKNWYDRAWGVNAKAALGDNVDLTVGYDKFMDLSTYTDKNERIAVSDYDDTGIFNAGLMFKLGKDFKLGATYLHTSADEDAGFSDKNNGFFATAQFMGAKAKEVGSWGLTAKYYQMPAGAVAANGWDDGTTAKKSTLYVDGFKGWYAGAKVTVAKNMIAGVQYWDLKSRVHSDNRNKELWADLVVTF